MFIEFGIKDFIDILLVALLLYKVYKLMKETGSINIFVGVLIFLGVWVLVSQVLDMRLLGGIFDLLQNVGILALIVLFQKEIRGFLLSLGARGRARSFFKFFGHAKSQSVDRAEIMPLVLACLNMSKQKVGALIVIEQEVPLTEVIRTGDTINANITQRLVENIFFKNSPLHDGAMIISNNRIKAAGCILPVSHDLNIPRHLGLRHRAALGISQVSDAVVIVVSEQTGAISTAHEGQFRLRLSAEELERELTRVKVVGK
ncbi:MAG: diadenylate cyclase CdaA [Bacteroidaceae bacterium]|nr:diadenylate cyclase CdaA [Bacteroidaceae bacterium]